MIPPETEPAGIDERLPSPQPGRRTRRQVATVLLVVLGSAAYVVLAWQFAARVLAADRGVDLTDESLYFLSLDPPSPHAGWLFRFGWHLAPVFWLADYDIERMRTLGAVALMVASSALAFVLTLVVATCVGDHAPRTSRWFAGGGVALLAGLACLMFYTWMTRTPGYDWLNLFAITLGSTFIFAWLGKCMARPDGIGAVGVTLVVAAAASAFIGLPAKPTTWGVLLVLIVVLTWLWAGPAQAARATATFLITTAVLVAAAFASGLWPTDAPQVWMSALGNQAFHPNQTAPVALARELAIPGTWLSSLWQVDRLIKYPLLAVWFAMAFFAWRRHRGIWLLGPFLLSVLLLTISAGRTGYLTFLADATTAGIGFSVSAILLVIGVWRSEPARLPGLHGRRILVRLATLPLSLILLSMAFGLGSLNSPYSSIARCWALVVLAPVALLLLVGKRAVVPIVAVGMAALWLTGLGLSNGWQQPLGVAGPISAQTVEVEFGPNQSRLLVSREQESYFVDVVSAVREAGFAPGTPLLGAVWQWSTGVTYLVSGKAPPTLMLSILYPSQAAIDIQGYHAEELPCDPWKDAWIVTSGSQVLEPDQAHWVAEALKVTTTPLGRVFPDDYTRVVSVRDLEFWKPSSVGVPQGERCGIPAQGSSIEGSEG